MKSSSALASIGLGVLLVAMVTAGGMVLYNPPLLTGHFYEMRIESITIDPKGLVHVTYDETITYDTFTEWHDAEDGHDVIEFWKHHESKLFRWPATKRSRTLDFWLPSPDERKAGAMDSPELRKRLLISVGTYRLQWKDRLVYLRRPNSDGKTAKEFTEAYVRVGR